MSGSATKGFRCGSSLATCSGTVRSTVRAAWGNTEMKTIWMAAGALALGTLGAVEVKNKPKFYSDDPVMAMPAPVSAAGVKPRSLSEYYDFFENTLFTPGERGKNGQYLPSQGINTVDEVPNSAWYTNRHASKRMSLEELQKGAGNTT